MGTTDRGLAQRQQQVMAMQDDMILDIEQGTFPLPCVRPLVPL